MKVVILLLFISLSSIEWLGDLYVAKEKAVKEHKLILINFSGSDWCGPCIRLRKEIFETGDFEKYAFEHLVLIRADFPRQKKNQLNNAQIKRNEALADKYNPDGKFPYTLLLDEHGKVLKIWDGFLNENKNDFLAQIKSLVNAGH